MRWMWLHPLHALLPWSSTMWCKRKLKNARLHASVGSSGPLCIHNLSSLNSMNLKRTNITWDECLSMCFSQCTVECLCNLTYIDSYFPSTGLLISLCFWPGRKGGSHSRRRGACRPPALSSTSRLCITEPGRPPLGKSSWWSSLSPPALDALPTLPAHSGTWRRDKTQWSGKWNFRSEWTDGWKRGCDWKQRAKTTWIRKWKKLRGKDINDQLIVTDRWMAEWTR